MCLCADLLKGNSCCIQMRWDARDSSQKTRQQLDDVLWMNIAQDEKANDGTKMSRIAG